MIRFAQTAEAIAATTKKNEKVRVTAEYLNSLTVEDAATAALFLSGRAFPAWEDTILQVGGTMLWRIVGELSELTDQQMGAVYQKHGDLGSAAFEMMSPSGRAQNEGPSLAEVARTFRDIAAARRAALKAALARQLLERASPLEAKYLIKIMTGEMRIGLRESLVEEAIAKAYGDPTAQVQRANMLLGDIAETLRLAASHRLSEARMRLFHPLGFMLATPAETAEEAFAEFTHAQVEDKYDGIRAQAHVGWRGDQREVRLFSRTLDDVTGAFPELVAPLAAFADDVILDGEVVAWDASGGEVGHALPFADLQKRIGRKKVTAAMMRQVPVAYVAFDVLYAGGELRIDQPLRERAAVLDGIFAAARKHAAVATTDPQGQLVFEAAVTDDGSEGAPSTPVLRAPSARADSPERLEELFEAALERGNEGLMIKDVDSPYAPGRRGKSWLKLKRVLATLDVVVTAAELGHGKRAGVLSDYTFAIREGDRLLNIGKAYSGLTDREIAEMHDWFLAHTLENEGWRRIIEPKIVIEVGFNVIMRSDRHNSGYALRFPRILRLRPDKPASEIDTLDTVRRIYERQHLPRTAV